jgi:hypothetical protein
MAADGDRAAKAGTEKKAWAGQNCWTHEGDDSWSSGGHVWADQPDVRADKADDSWSSRCHDWAAKAGTDKKAGAGQRWPTNESDDSWSTEGYVRGDHVDFRADQADDSWSSKGHVRADKADAEDRLACLSHRVIALEAQVAAMACQARLTPAPRAEASRTEEWCFSRGFHQVGMGVRLAAVQVKNMEYSQWAWITSLESKGMGRIPLRAALRRHGSDWRFHREGKAYYVAQIACYHCWTQFQVSVDDGASVTDGEMALARFLLVHDTQEMQLDASQATY